MDENHNWCYFRKGLQRLAKEICQACDNKICKHSRGRSSPVDDVVSNMGVFGSGIKLLQPLKKGIKARRKK